VLCLVNCWSAENRDDPPHREASLNTPDVILLRVIKALMGSAGFEPASSGYEPPALTIELRARKLASRANDRQWRANGRNSRVGTTVGTPLMLLCSFVESQPVKSLLGMAVACRRTKLNELIWGYFNVDADPIGVPFKTVLVFLTGLLLFPLRKRLRHVGVHETAKSLVIICSQLGKVKDRHSALDRIFLSLTHTEARYGDRLLKEWGDG
jgi:hypothetical protein